MVLLLGYFPTLFKDELLYSGIARYHQHSGNQSQKQTIRDLFGNRLVCATVDLPSHLKLLANKIQNVYTVSELIEKHTLLPYYSHFMDQDKCERLKALMVEGSTEGVVHVSLGLPAGHVKPPKYLRCCPSCYEENKVFGEPYWHRSHQLPGVVICREHGVLLKVSKIAFTTNDHKFKFVPLSKIGIEELIDIIVDPGWTEILQNISEESFRMLKSSSTQQVPNYRPWVLQSGYLTVGGKIRFDRLISDFRNHYGDKFLQFLSCEIDSGQSDTWLHKAIRGDEGITQPLRHLLLLRFFGCDSDSRILLEQKGPFGLGPWPCLNKAADHYREEVIKECVVTRCSSTKLPVGTFSCSCGFVYSRRGPDKNEIDKYKIGRIKSFGPVWLKKLKVLNEGSTSLRKRAAILGVDPMTVKNQSKCIG